MEEQNLREAIKLLQEVSEKFSLQLKDLKVPDVNNTALLKTILPADIISKVVNCVTVFDNVFKIGDLKCELGAFSELCKGQYYISAKTGFNSGIDYTPYPIQKQDYFYPPIILN